MQVISSESWIKLRLVGGCSSPLNVKGIALRLSLHQAYQIHEDLQSLVQTVDNRSWEWAFSIGFFQNAMHRSLLMPTFPDLILQQKEDECSDLLTTFIQNKKRFVSHSRCFTEILPFDNKSMHLSRDLFYHQLTRCSFVSEALVYCNCKSVFLSCGSSLLYQWHFVLGHLTSKDLSVCSLSFSYLFPVFM